MTDPIEQLIIQFLQDRITADDAHRLRAWREASDENEATFRQTERLWAITAHAELRSLNSPAPKARHLTAHDRAGASRRGRGSRYTRRIVAAAALIVLGFGIAKIWSDRLFPDAGDFATGQSEMVTATLSDGSLVHLAPQSRLRFVNGEDQRTAWLEGQAFFAIAENEDAPFVVHTRLGEASVLGTRFDLRVGGEELRLVVVEGKVRLAASDAEVDVNRGELSRVQRGAAPTVDVVDDMYAYVDWLGGTFVFQATSLAEALDEIEQRFGRQVELLDPALADRTVTAWFTNRPFEEVVTAVCRVVQATCSIDDSRATVGP